MNFMTLFALTAAFAGLRIEEKPNEHIGQITRANLTDIIDELISQNGLVVVTRENEDDEETRYMISVTYKRSNKRKINRALGIKQDMVHDLAETLDQTLSQVQFMVVTKQDGRYFTATTIDKEAGALVAKAIF